MGEENVNRGRIKTRIGKRPTKFSYLFDNRKYHLPLHDVALILEQHLIGYKV